MTSAPLYNEKDLLLRVADGDEHAFRIIYDQYRNKILTIANKVLYTESEVFDALQEVFVKLWINRARLPEVENFNAYINTVTRNHLYNVLRRYAYEETLVAEIGFKTAGDYHEGEQELNIRELKRTLYAAIDKLAPQQKKVFELSRLEGLKYEEIASQLNLSRETVKRHLSEATKNLRTILGSHHEALALLIVIGLT